MKIARALRLTLVSLLRPEILLMLFVPFVVSLILWFAIFWFFWGAWVAGLSGLLQSTWLMDWLGSGAGLESLSGLHWVSGLFLVLIFLPLTYLTALLLTSGLVMPLMVQMIVRRDYADLEKLRGGSLRGSVWNSLWAGGIYLFLFALSLPFWLVPGLAFVLPVLLNAWLNKRVFVYDSLQDFAAREEFTLLERRERGRLYGLGILLALLTYLPLVSFILPVLSGLAYAHYCLGALREQRLTKTRA